MAPPARHHRVIVERSSRETPGGLPRYGREQPRTVEEAYAIQDRLRATVDTTGPGPTEPWTVAGLDVAYAATGDRLAAAVVVCDGDEVVGRVLRTRTGVKPVFVSVGHLISLDNACARTLALAPRYRLPETTREADRRCRRALLAGA